MRCLGVSIFGEVDYAFATLVAGVVAGVLTTSPALANCVPETGPGYTIACGAADEVTITYDASFVGESLNWNAEVPLFMQNAGSFDGPLSMVAPSVVYRGTGGFIKGADGTALQVGSFGNSDVEVAQDLSGSTGILLQSQGDSGAQNASIRFLSGRIDSSF